MQFGFVALETFDSKYGESWNNYIKFCGLTHLKEVITLDGCLCPSLLKNIDNIDDRFFKWINNNDNLYYRVFNNLDWLLKTVNEIPEKQILAVCYEPQKDYFSYFVDNRFVFRGFDVVDHLGGISALLNCGGFEKAFSSKDISSYGLIEKYEKAKKIRDTLSIEYPDEPHADCELWGIWRLERV